MSCPPTNEAHWEGDIQAADRDELARQVRSLHRLLSDPQPESPTWKAAVAHRLKRLRAHLDDMDV